MRMRVWRRLLHSALGGMAIAGCVPAAEEQSGATAVPQPDTAIVEETDFDSTEIVFGTGSEDESDSIAVETESESEPQPWDYLKNLADDSKVGDLLLAASTLADKRRTGEALAVAELASPAALEPPHSIDLLLLQARISFIESDPVKLQQNLRALGNRIAQMNRSQYARMLRIAADAHAAVGNYVDLARTLMALRPEVADDAQKFEVGHRIIRTLRKLSVEDLSLALSRTSDPQHAAWFQLAMAINGVVHDPHQYSLALQDWADVNPAHPANALIADGLLPAPPLSAPIRKIALVVPLTSDAATAVHAFAEGVSAQHAADSNPFKPELDVYDIGSEPELTTWYFDQAIQNGADFVIGPIGVRYVQEIVDRGRFGAPTLLLGDSGKSSLPGHVFQFALSPEQEGAGIAERARQKGYKYALVMHPPTRWAKRTLDGFVSEWSHTGGVVLDTFEYGLKQSDYSELSKSLLNVEASAERYAIVRTLARKPVQFIPRRRQDADFILLISDPFHGRLIKPHIDFLKAHNLPVFSTSRIFDGEPNPINDNDLNGIEFSDMAWMIEQSEAMRGMRKQFKTPWQKKGALDRLFAMGVDSYNLAFRVSKLRDNPTARHHGVTSLIGSDRRNRLIREPSWAVFSEGLPKAQPDFIMQSIPVADSNAEAADLPMPKEQR